MGRYNVHAPQVLGNEWVPIQDARYVPDDVTERGYRWRQTSNVNITDAAFGVADSGERPGRNTAELIAVYEAGVVADTGPAEVTVLPVTGSLTTTGTPVLVGGATVAECLALPTDGKRVTFTASGGNPTLNLDLFFTAASFAGILTDRRVLAVEVEYVIVGDAAVPAIDAVTNIGMLRTQDQTRIVWAAHPIDAAASGDTAVRLAELGELNLFWQAAAAPPDAGTAIFPFNYEQLTRFDTAALADRRQAIRINVQAAAAGTISIEYVALRITHCAETRRAVGAWHRRQAGVQYPVGSVLTPLRDPLLLSQPVALSSGIDYVTTQCNVFAPDQAATAAAMQDRGTPPSMHALRQLYPIVHPNGTTFIDGALVHRTRQAGVTFAFERSDILSQVTLHPSSGIVSNCHPFGTQVGAPVFFLPGTGDITAQQKIDTGQALGGSYRWVTFYARKFGQRTDGTTETLTVSSVETPAATASITADDFFALPEIIDGWRKVTLQFAAPVVIAAASTQNIKWNTNGITGQGLQWQILGADGPSLSGANAFGPATYGSTSNTLTWRLPTTGVVASDLLSDATVMLSIIPATPTNLAAVLQQQDLLPSLSECEDQRCCMVTEAAYVHLTWDASTLPAGGGFGYWELTRTDADSGVDQVIMTSTDSATLSFDDYEAPIGNLITYSLRVYDSAGIPSDAATTSITVTPPGVTPECANGSGYGWLIFSSNADPSLTCAYKMVWPPGQAEEDFSFPEAETVELRRMYQRDYQVAFRPSERGGETFKRDLLIDHNRILGSSSDHYILANIRKLRDVAWADVPYVCVRDTAGNSWFATVIVPDGSFRWVGKIYTARNVEIVETTATAAPTVITL